MTTIATDGKTLAGDRRGTTNQGALLTDSERKISVQNYAGPGELGPSLPSAWGFAGEWPEWTKFLRWLREGAPEDKKPELGEHFEALQLTASGAVFYWDKHFIPESRTPPCAIGSGWPFAVGAMKAGNPADEAVRVAMECDVFTGGGVDAITVDDLRPGRKMAAE